MTPADILNEEFKRRKDKNSRYSLRAFAKSIGMQAPTVSGILRNKRPFPIHEAERVLTKLNWRDEQRHQFIESLSLQNLQTPIQDYLNTPVVSDHEKLTSLIVSDWEYAAVLALMDVQGFSFSNEWIAERLNLTSMRALEVMNNLKLSGLLIEENEGPPKRNDIDLRSSDEVLSIAVRKAHLQELNLAKEKLISVALEKRDFTSNTFSFSEKDMKKVKVMIRSFHKKIEQIAQSRKNKNEVYQICIQLYPLTKL